MENYIKELKQKLKIEDFIYLRIKGIPGSTKTEFSELLNGVEPTLKIRLSAPPEKNKANKECIKFLNNFFDADCEIVSGGTAKVKLVKIHRN